MRFAPHKCPECGKEAKGTIETLQALAFLTFTDEEGTAEYEGYTDVIWDTQQTVVKDGKVTLQCPNGHEWEATEE
jgi:hypothetical protein